MNYKKVTAEDLTADRRLLNLLRSSGFPDHSAFKIVGLIAQARA